MKTITTRDLVHRTREIRESLERGESFQWSQRGRVVAVLQAIAPPRLPEPVDWMQRARAAGVVAAGTPSVAALVSEARGE